MKQFATLVCRANHCPHATRLISLPEASALPFQVFAASSHPFQQSVVLSTDFSEPFQDLCRQHTNRGKRSQDFDDNRAYKQARTDLKSRSELTEDNLRQLDECNLREPDSLSDMGLKRAQSTLVGQCIGREALGPKLPACTI